MGGKNKKKAATLGLVKGTNHHFSGFWCDMDPGQIPNTVCVPLPGRWLRSTVQVQLRWAPTTGGGCLPGWRPPRSGTPPCRPEAASAWRCRSWAARSRIDIAGQLHPAVEREQRWCSYNYRKQGGCCWKMCWFECGLSSKSQKGHTHTHTHCRGASQMFSSGCLNGFRLSVTWRLLMDKVLWNTVQATACSHPGVVIDPTYR